MKNYQILEVFCDNDKLNRLNKLNRLEYKMKLPKLLRKPLLMCQMLSRFTKNPRIIEAVY